jgi:hypothetical protein
MRARKVQPGIYTHLGHRICREDATGPEGGIRRYWSISGPIGTPGEHYAHPENPQLETLSAACDWLEAKHPGDRHRIEHDNEPRVWGE